MRFSWLNDMVDSELITKEASDRIEEDCNNIIKQAGLVGSEKRMASALEDLVRKLQSMHNTYAKSLERPATSFGDKAIDLGLTSLITALPIGLASAAGTYVGRKMDISGATKKLENSRQAIISDPKFTDSDAKAKAEARFHEMVSIAPHVAMNTPLATKIIEHKLERGFSDEDFHQLTALQQKYTPRFEDQMNYMPKKAELREEKLGEILADMYQITKTASQDKEAVSDSLSRILALSSIPILGGVGVGLANAYLSHRDSAEMSKRLEESFRLALRADNDQGALLREKKDKAREAFEALVHFAPRVAAQPGAANAFMAKMVSYDQGLNVSDVKELSEIQRNLHQITPIMSPVVSGFVGGTKSLGLGKAVEEGAKAIIGRG